MVKICPISERKINENVSRLNAFFTFLMSVSFLLTGSYIVLSIVIIDFSFRLIAEGKLNPLIKFNSFLLDNFNISKALINAGPKIFAARIGLLLSSSALIFAVPGFHNAAITTIMILGFFSFLESVFGFCVACKLYPYALVLNGPSSRDKI